MNKLIKAEWAKRLAAQDGVRPEQRHSAEFILNSLYEEVTGDLILYPNRRKVHAPDGTVPEFLTFGENEPIHDKVRAWAEIDDKDPLLPSYPLIGGEKIPANLHKLHPIQRDGYIFLTWQEKVSVGRFVTRTGHRHIRSSEVADLIIKDL